MTNKFMDMLKVEIEDNLDLCDVKIFENGYRCKPLFIANASTRDVYLHNPGKKFTLLLMVKAGDIHIGYLDFEGELWATTYPDNLGVCADQKNRLLEKKD